MPEERFNPALLLTTTEVGELLDVHPSTVKRWCNEEDLPFAKTDGGHRRIHLRDALDLAASRGIPTFLAPFAPYEGHVWSALQGLLNEGDVYRAVSLCLGWLTSGSTERVGTLITMLGQREDIPLTLVIDGVIQGFMAEVGDGWRSGRIRVADEHIASQVIIEALLGLRAPEGSQSGETPVQATAVVGSMEGDLHHIGSLCVRVLLERAGWRVAYLGPDVPVEEFAAVQTSASASLVCVSFSPPHTLADIRRAVRILSEFYREEHPYALAVGGTRVIENNEDLTLEGPFPTTGVFQSAQQFVDWVHGIKAGSTADSYDDGAMGGEG
jgi:excisionase family DNA binding protein